METSKTGAESSQRSVYRSAARFMGWMFTLMFTWPIVTFLVVEIWRVQLAPLFLLLLLASAFLSTVFFRCPSCATSVFRSGRNVISWRHPWPRRSCSGCGVDLTTVRDGSWPAEVIRRLKDRL